MQPALIVPVAAQLGIPLKSVEATVALLDEGGTVPFIARYRKEATGNLDEVQIRAIEEKVEYFRELDQRRRTVLQSIEEQGKLTADLRARIEAVLEKNELEDLYLPYKPKRRTRASIAREKGLEPLARYLWEQRDTGVTLDRLAADAVNPEMQVASSSEALAGARDIVAEWVAEDAAARKAMRAMMLAQGVVTSRAVEGAEDPERKFQMYVDYREPAATIPSHRMLAIRRGAAEGILAFEIDLPPAPAVAWLKSHLLRARGPWTPHLEQAIEDAYERLLNPSIQTEVRLELKDRSDLAAIQVFRQNLENLLLAAPAGRLAVLAIDPGIRTGCKLAVVDDTGKYLENAVIFPLEPRNDLAGAVKTLSALIAHHPVQAIAIGNGTGSREVSAFVRDFLRQTQRPDIFSVVVSEAGASVYSASDIARQEFPDLDLTVRGAISIARRLQDPLAELVKIDPKSIGVGQYQHDVDQRKLKQGLEATVESCVNRVGVDLNTASFALLRYVAGIRERTAEKIVEYRNEHGRFRSRAAILEVPGFGPKTFEQAAGFLRIRGGDNPLDMTAVHPESYPVVERIAQSLNVTVEELIARPALIDQVPLDRFRTGQTGEYTLADIRDELRRPGRDPRDRFIAPVWRDDVKEISDLRPGMDLEGVVTNVTAFGAFVDVGVHHDGLVHVSELSHRFVRDPHEIVKTGQIVRVRVLSADPQTRRIGLSMKALEKNPQPAAKPRPRIEEQINRLADRFKTR